MVFLNTYIMCHKCMYLKREQLRSRLASPLISSDDEQWAQNSAFGAGPLNTSPNAEGLLLSAVRTLDVSYSDQVSPAFCGSGTAWKTYLAPLSYSVRGCLSHQLSILKAEVSFKNTTRAQTHSPVKRACHALRWKGLTMCKTRCSLAKTCMQRRFYQKRKHAVAL